MLMRELWPLSNWNRPTRLFEQQFAFALQLCSQALRVLGAHAPVYDCASDAYLNLRKFHEAELCLLQAMALGCSNAEALSQSGEFREHAWRHQPGATSFAPSRSSRSQSSQLEQIRSNLDKRSGSF